MDDSDVAAIVAAAGSVRVPQLMANAIRVAASGYRLLKSEQAPPRDETRYHLRMIAHLSWMIDQHPSEAARYWSQLRTVMRDCNREVFESLRATLREEFGRRNAYEIVDFRPLFAEHRLYAFAALGLERALGTRGDYANDALQQTIAFLFLIFDTAACRFPTFSRKAVGPIGIGTHRKIAGSDCGRFMLEFFRFVDPSVSPTLVTNAFATCRKRHVDWNRAGRPYARELAKQLYPANR